MNEKFKIKVEKMVQQQKTRVKDKNLFKLIEKLVNEDPLMKKWIEDEEDEMESEKN